MVVRRLRLYIEGGSEGSKADSDFRRGWKKFLQEVHLLAQDHGFQSLEVVRGKGRENAFQRFKSHYRNFPNDLCALLVDSEREVPAHCSPWGFVHQWGGWQRPSWAAEGQLYLMVAFVESWLLSDPDALEDYYKRGFKRSQLPTTNLEARSKQEISQALDRATTASAKGPYRHGQAHEIIALVKPERVKTLRHGLRLFDGLRQLITGEGNSLKS